MRRSMVNLAQSELQMRSLRRGWMSTSYLSRCYRHSRSHGQPVRIQESNEELEASGIEDAELHVVAKDTSRRLGG